MPEMDDLDWRLMRMGPYWMPTTQMLCIPHRIDHAIAEVAALEWESRHMTFNAQSKCYGARVGRRFARRMLARARERYFTIYLSVPDLVPMRKFWFEYQGELCAVMIAEIETRLFVEAYEQVRQRVGFVKLLRWREIKQGVGHEKPTTQSARAV